MGQPIAKVQVQYNNLQTCKSTQIVCKEDVKVQLIFCKKNILNRPLQMFLRLLYHIFLAKVLEIYEAKLPAGLLYDVTCLSMRGIWPLWPILWYFLPFLRILLWHTPTMGQPAQTWDWQRPPPRDNSLIILMSDIFSLADKKSADNRSRAPLMFTFITFIIHIFHQHPEKAEMD